MITVLIHRTITMYVLRSSYDADFNDDGDDDDDDDGNRNQ